MAIIGDQADQVDVTALMKDPQVVKLYVNGFNVGTSLSDVFMVTSSGATPVAVIQMSFTTAKTLMQVLNQIINDFEEKTGQPLLSMGEIKEKCFPGMPNE